MIRYNTHICPAALWPFPTNRYLRLNIFKWTLLFPLLTCPTHNPPHGSFSVQFSHSVVSNSLQPRGLQHTRLPCPSPTPRACSISCPSSQWCYPIISSFVISFSRCVQSFPASGFFPMSQFFVSGGQSTEASESVLPMNIQDWFPLEFDLVWVACSPRNSQECSPTHFKSINSSEFSFLYSPAITSMHDY